MPMKAPLLRATLTAISALYVPVMLLRVGITVVKTVRQYDDTLKEDDLLCDEEIETRRWWRIMSKKDFL